MPTISIEKHEGCEVSQAFIEELQVLIEKYTRKGDKNLKGLILNGVVIGEDHDHSIIVNYLKEVNGAEVARGVINLIETQEQGIAKLHHDLTK